jgi:riboflavin kinase/FMN adenylyltransferase
MPFTREVSLLEPGEFVERVLVGALDARAVLVGHNFRFGHLHAGDTKQLTAFGERFGFLTEIVPAVRLRGRVVSSSEVRRQVEAGRVSLACRLLETPFAIEGAVVPGHGVGSKQTVPTLNLAPSPEGVVPATGVYITRTHGLTAGRAWPSVTNVGHRPTFGGGALVIETFLLQPLEPPPLAEIRVEFLLRLRAERKFTSAGELKAQILKDVARARTYFRRSATC